MAPSTFDEKAARPGSQELALMLGRTSRLWLDLVARMETDFGPLAEEWKVAGKTSGPSARLKKADRVIVYLKPCQEHFLASFALGERACKAAHAAGLPASILALIDAAPKYAEGRGVRIPVRTKRDVESILALAAIKLKN